MKSFKRNISWPRCRVRKSLNEGKIFKDVREEPIRDVAGSLKKVTRGNTHNCKTGNNLAIEDAE
jgi:hypothetical protein